MSSISALVSECNEPGRLDRMSGRDTRPFKPTGAIVCDFFIDRFDDYSLNARPPLLGAGLQDLIDRLG